MGRGLRLYGSANYRGERPPRTPGEMQTNTEQRTYKLYNKCKMLNQLCRLMQLQKKSYHFLSSKFLLRQSWKGAAPSVPMGVGGARAPSAPGPMLMSHRGPLQPRGGSIWLPASSGDYPGYSDLPGSVWLWGTRLTTSTYVCGVHRPPTIRDLLTNGCLFRWAFPGQIFFISVYFFVSEFRSIPKNSGPNPGLFRF